MANDTQQTANNARLFIKLYQSAFPSVARYVSRRGGSFDEAKDVFQDALVIYYEKHISGNQSPVNAKAYLMGIAKHLWIKSYQNNSRYVPLDEANNLDITIPQAQQPITNKILHYLESTGEKCMDLLKSFYYDKLPMTDIAQTFGFSGERSATVQKFKCLEKVRETVKSKSLTYEDFVE
ncbi:RNA polymerase sigma factor [Mucilaginibacter boryungensis]|uniref:Sigma-70 family RNA polymerase sigma factor n=1 Tax=Mucilaginibacter boryungensis TaxID=768480 RepID=A0ABR9XEG0_9SPHI|nr:sigma-70 family RNA polymerase sigma factor [Mucilaginibacter boryungensis]MBE9665572.1 sigma-70 family RNA polymerase sigma factor [Mucilaginibacter boryungensis]